MGINNADVGLFQGVFRGPDAPEMFLQIRQISICTMMIASSESTYTLILIPMDRAFYVAVAQHAKFEERQSHWLREKYPTNFGRYVGERIPDAANHEVFESCSFLHERRPVPVTNKEPPLNEFIW